MVRFVRENAEQTKERIKKDEFGFWTTVVFGKNVNKSTIISNLGAAAHYYDGCEIITEEKMKMVCLVTPETPFEEIGRGKLIEALKILFNAP